MNPLSLCLSWLCFIEFMGNDLFSFPLPNSHPVPSYVHTFAYMVSWTAQDWMLNSPMTFLPPPLAGYGSSAFQTPTRVPKVYSLHYTFLPVPFKVKGSFSNFLERFAGSLLLLAHFSLYPTCFSAGHIPSMRMWAPWGQALPSFSSLSPYAIPWIHWAVSLLKCIELLNKTGPSFDLWGALLFPYLYLQKFPSITMPGTLFLSQICICKGQPCVQKDSIFKKTAFKVRNTLSEAFLKKVQTWMINGASPQQYLSPPKL